MFLSLTCAAVMLLPAAAQSQIQLQLKLKPSATLSVTGAPNQVVQLQWRSDLSTNGRWLHIDHCVLSNAPSVLALSGVPAPGNRFYCAVETPSTNLVLIPGSPFTMGDTFGEGNSDELPLHTVNVSAFLMDKYEVTWGMWTNVYHWATNRPGDLRYVFEYGAQGKAATHPAHSMTWYEAVKWCNARSEKEGKIPAYYTDAGLTVRYRTWQVAPFVNWTTGYRLPTEAEWEKAARGGSAGHRFPWSSNDNITHSLANYWSSTSYAYDTSTTRGYHPTFKNGVPYTSPVGYFSANANGYGLYDMAGNVWEWCWDRYGPYSSATQTDPRGPPFGSGRVGRGGGGWGSMASNCRTADRVEGNPIYADSYIGFRCVLPPGQ